MKRDLIFFLSGLLFGAAIGYFLVSALSPTQAVSERQVAAPVTDGLELGPDESRDVLDSAKVAALEAEAEASPQDPAPLLELGRVYMAAGRHDAAASSLRKAAQMDGQNMDARNLLALALLELGNTQEAASAYESVLASEPANPQALLGLGRIKLYILRDIEGGLSLWEALLQEAPDSEEARGVRDELEALRSAHEGA